MPIIFCERKEADKKGRTSVPGGTVETNNGRGKRDSESDTDPPLQKNFPFLPLAKDTGWSCSQLAANRVADFVSPF